MCVCIYMNHLVIEGLTHEPLLNVASLGTLPDHLVLGVDVHYHFHEVLVQKGHACLSGILRGQRPIFSNTLATH